MISVYYFSLAVKGKIKLIFVVFIVCVCSCWWLEHRIRRINKYFFHCCSEPMDNRIALKFNV